MAEKILIVVDMQKDFVNGSLGSKDAEAIVPAVVKKAKEFDGDLIFTKDTHFENYMDTQEGHFLPVPHCMKGTDGWNLIPELEKIFVERDAALYEKITFGCPELAEALLESLWDSVRISVWFQTHSSSKRSSRRPRSSWIPHVRQA
mgnify:CR=1 FL=1